MSLQEFTDYLITCDEDINQLSGEEKRAWRETFDKSRALVAPVAMAAPVVSANAVCTLLKTVCSNDIDMNVVNKVLYWYRNQVRDAILEKNATLLKYFYDSLLHSYKTTTKAKLAKKKIFVNGELGSPCANWQVAFHESRPYILKPLADPFELKRIAQLMNIHFDSPHVVQFIVMDIRKDDTTQIIQSPAIKSQHTQSVKSDPRTHIMMMPVLPLTIEHMTTDAFKLVVGRFIAEMRHGLQAIHHAGFAHMDVKPSNIAVQSDGTFVLIDLGSCCKFNDPTMSDPTMSTTAFVPLSMKVTLGNNYTSSTDYDWWMLAMTVYEKVEVEVEDKSNADCTNVLDYFRTNSELFAVPEIHWLIQLLESQQLARVTRSNNLPIRNDIPVLVINRY